MSTAKDRLKIAKSILNFEARRDNSGRLKVYYLPADDGGGEYEVGGINERYHPQQAALLRNLIEAGQFDDAETTATEYIAAYTDVASQWTTHTAVESYLRDCIFNRGTVGAARIYQIALGVKVDGSIGPITIGEAAKEDPLDLLLRLRTARERYERKWVGRDETSHFWKGLVNRWDKALGFAKEFLDATADNSPDGVGAAPTSPPVPNFIPATVSTAVATVAAADVNTSDDKDRIARLCELASNVTTLDSVQAKAAADLMDYDGEVYPHDGCAITLSVLLQGAGINVPLIYQAIELGRHLKDIRKWQVIPLGQHQAGDIGSTCGTEAHHGSDHVYLVLKKLNDDEMLIADNQRMYPHSRFVSGQGKTPTKFFLRAA